MDAEGGRGRGGGWTLRGEGGGVRTVYTHVTRMSDQHVLGVKSEKGEKIKRCGKFPYVSMVMRGHGLGIWGRYI